MSHELLDTGDRNVSQDEVVGEIVAELVWGKHHTGLVTVFGESLLDGTDADSLVLVGEKEGRGVGDGRPDREVVSHRFFDLGGEVDGSFFAVFAEQLEARRPFAEIQISQLELAHL